MINHQNTENPKSILYFFMIGLYVKLVYILFYYKPINFGTINPQAHPTT